MVEKNEIYVGAPGCEVLALPLAEPLGAPPCAPTKSPLLIPDLYLKDYSKGSKAEH